MDIITNLQEFGALVKVGLIFVGIIVVSGVLFTIPGVRALISHLFKDILVDHVLKTVWGKRVATVIVCVLALGAAAWTGLWMFNGVSETAQVIATDQAESELQERYAELHARVVAHEAANTPEEVEVEGKTLVDKAMFWKKDAVASEPRPCISATFEVVTGKPIAATARVDNRDNMPGVLVTVHNNVDTKHLYAEKPMRFHVHQRVDDNGSTTWSLARDTRTRRGFENDAAYLHTATHAVRTLTRYGCAL